MYIVKEPCTIALNESDCIYPDELFCAMERAGLVSEVVPVEIKNDDNPLMWNGRYITQWNTKAQLYQCLLSLGMDVSPSDSFQALKKKREEYLTGVYQSGRGKKRDRERCAKSGS